MAFVVLVFALTALAIWAGIKVGKKDGIVEEGIVCGLSIIFMGGLVGTMILGAIGSVTAEQADRKLLETRTLTIAEGSPFKAENGSVEFVEKKEDGSLEAHDQPYSKLVYESLSIKQVEIKKYDVYHYYVFPWVYSDSHYVTIK